MFNLALLALAAVASANPIDLAERDSSNFCSSVSAYLGSWANPTAASSFCSSFESIKTSTVTLTSTLTSNNTVLTTTTSTSTYYPTVTASVTATCTTTSAAARIKRSTASSVVATSTSCSVCPSAAYACNYKGGLSSSNKISTPSGCGSIESCRSACFGNSNCASFSFDTSNNCQHYGSSLFNMGLSPNSGSSLTFWQKSCFSCSTTTTTIPASATKTTSTSSVTTYPVASSLLSSACSCIGVNPSPMTTSTVTVTTQKIVATNTITSMATVTATSTSTTTTTVATVSFYSNQTFTATDGDVYKILPAQDLLGYNLYQGSCGATPSDLNAINTPYGNFSCDSFSDCINICSEYNDAAASAIAAGQAQMCLGATAHISTPFCYLKSAIAGNGAPVCQVTGDSSDDNSAVIVSRHTW